MRIIAPGSAFRRDEIDATHLSVFNQIEGLYVAEGVTLADLKGTLQVFLPGTLRPRTRRSGSARTFSRSRSRASRSTFS